MSSSKPHSGETIRLEGMVVQKRLGRVETTRYLVLDLTTGHICLYRDPPPDIAVLQKKQRPNSAASRMKSRINSIVNSNSISLTELEDAHLALTHINRERRPGFKQRKLSKIRELRGDSWEPKFVVPPEVDWKIR